MKQTLALVQVVLIATVGLVTSENASAAVMPQPTGPYSVGATRTYFEDTGRPNLLTGDPNRTIATTVWYPTTATAGKHAKFLSDNPVNDVLMAPRIAESWRDPSVAASITNLDTPALLDAPVRTDLGMLPVVIWQPGLGNPRAMGTSIGQDLASLGFVVVAIDPPDSPIVEYADGVVNNGPVHRTDDQDWMNRVLNNRVRDTSKVISSLRELPLGIGAVVDSERVGATGHSYGGYAALAAAYEDDRIDAAMAIDGTASWAGTDTPKPGSVATDGLDIPALALSAQGGDIARPSWDEFRNVMRGWFGDVRVNGALHNAFTDACLMLREICGSIAPGLANQLTRNYTNAFFAQFLRGSEQPLLVPASQVVG